jgi:hypothetical protein
VRARIAEAGCLVAEALLFHPALASYRGVDLVSPEELALRVVL